MATQRFQYKEKFSVEYLGASSEDFIGVLRANFPELDLLWPNGTDASEADKFWCDASRSVASGASDDLDLKALANGPGGATINFAEIRAIFIITSSSNTTTLTLEPGETNGWTALGASLSLDLEAGVNLRLICPRDGAWPTAADDKVLSLTNGSGASATYGILIVGCGS